MSRTTCFLIIENSDYLLSTRTIFAEQFPKTTLRESITVEEMLSSVRKRGHDQGAGQVPQILITDRREVVDAVQQSGSYVPIVLLDQGNSSGASTQFSPSQVADSCDRPMVIDSISRALRLAIQFNSLSSKAGKLDTLADREKQIIAMASEGIPNKTIAVRLGISIKTVEKNRRKAYSKLSVTSTAEMACLVTFGKFFAAFAQ